MWGKGPSRSPAGPPARPQTAAFSGVAAARHWSASPRACTTSPAARRQWRLTVGGGGVAVAVIAFPLCFGWATFRHAVTFELAQKGIPHFLKMYLRRLKFVGLGEACADIVPFLNFAIPWFFEVKKGRFPETRQITKFKKKYNKIQQMRKNIKIANKNCIFILSKPPCSDHFILGRI